MSTNDAPGVRRRWRRCMALSCVGVCHWNGEAWVCEVCATRWTPDRDVKWAAPDVG